MTGVYLLVLISIPLSFMMVQSSQIFKSSASEVKPVKNITTATASAVPKSSPLEDLKKLTSQLPSESTESSSPTTASNFGPTLKFKAVIEGRPATNLSASKLFVGLAPGAPTTKPTYLLTFSLDLPASGVYSGLSLAGLTAGGNYTAYLKGPGQIDRAISFTMSGGETNLNSGNAIDLTSGDVNEDNTVSDADQTVVSSLYGTNTKSSNWNPSADFNADGVINNFDLNYVTKNLGKTGDSGVWVSAPQSGGPAGSVEGAEAEGMWIWVPSDHLYRP